MQPASTAETWQNAVNVLPRGRNACSPEAQHAAFAAMHCAHPETRQAGRTLGLMLDASNSVWYLPAGCHTVSVHIMDENVECDAVDMLLKRLFLT